MSYLPNLLRLGSNLLVAVHCPAVAGTNRRGAFLFHSFRLTRPKGPDRFPWIPLEFPIHPKLFQRSYFLAILHPIPHPIPLWICWKIQMILLLPYYGSGLVINPCGQGEIQVLSPLSA